MISLKQGKGTRSVKPRGSRFRGKNGKTKNIGRRMTKPKPLRRMRKAGRKVGKPRNQNWRKSGFGKKRRSGKSRSQNTIGNPANKDKVKIPTYNGRKKKIKRLPRPLRFGK